jgi:hypothetical protein
MKEKIVQQCRGIILDANDNWRVVSYPYDKFFNYDEPNAVEVDWNTVRIYEKLDGSLMTLYHYDGQWHVASSGLADASGEVMGRPDLTFADLFWKVWRELDYNLPKDTGVCYIFELMTPFNRIVVRHLTNRLVFHGARRLSDLRELSPIVEGHLNGWETVSVFPLDSWEEIISASESLDPMKGEGFVIADANYNRVKVKSSNYVLFARAKDSFSTRVILDKIRTNDTDEFMAKFLKEYPEYIGTYTSIKIAYERLLAKIEGTYDVIKHIEDRKTFASFATLTNYSGALFQAKFGTTTFKEYLSTMHIKNLEGMLNIEYTEL